MDARSAQRKAPPPTWAVRYAQIQPGPRFSRAGLRAVARHAVLSVAGTRARFEGPFLRCIYCHYVYDDQTAQFRAMLERLQHEGTFVTTAQVVEMARGQRSIDGRYFHLSFDDGFDNLHRNAAPILEDLGIRPAVFVPTDFMGLSDDRVVRDWWRPREIRWPTRPLTWPSIEELARRGWDIGSHTAGHARLSAIAGDRDRLEAEVVGSKREIERRLGRPCLYIAWPWGKLEDAGQRGLAKIAEAGYEAGFSTHRDRVRGPAGGTDRFAIPRHHFEPEWPWLHLRYYAAGGREPR